MLGDQREVGGEALEGLAPPRGRERNDRTDAGECLDLSDAVTVAFATEAFPSSTPDDAMERGEDVGEGRVITDSS